MFIWNVNVKVCCIFYEHKFNKKKKKKKNEQHLNSAIFLTEFLMSILSSTDRRV